MSMSTAESWCPSRYGAGDELGSLNEITLVTIFGAVPGEYPARPFLVPQTLNVKHGVFVMENLATEVLAAVGVCEFMFVLTHHQTRGSTAAVIALAAVV